MSTETDQARRWRERFEVTVALAVVIVGYCAVVATLMVAEWAGWHA